MSFQVLETSKKCATIYKDDKLHTRIFPKNLDATWSPHCEMPLDVLYAKHYVAGLSIEEVTPENLLGPLKKASDKMQACAKALVSSKVNLTDNCLHEVIPFRILKEFYDLKNQVVDHVIESREQPKNYQFLVDLDLLLQEMAKQELNLKRVRTLMLPTRSDKIKATKLVKGPNKVLYKMNASKTGRLTLHEESFPILNLKKNLRTVIYPKNDLFLELDFNASEVRTLLALSGIDQPEIDIHEWNILNIFKGNTDRAEAKSKFFFWLFNPEAVNLAIEKFYSKKIVDNYYQDGMIVTPFHRKIPSDDFHALNYLVQSTASDNFLTQALKLHKYLNKKRSFVSLLMHDAILIDLSYEEISDLEEIVDIFSKTTLGKFKINKSIGKNYGEMKAV